MDEQGIEYLLSIITELGGFEINDKGKEYIIGDECEGILIIIF